MFNTAIITWTNTMQSKATTTLNYYELQVLIARRKLSSISIVVGEA